MMGSLTGTIGTEAPPQVRVAPPQGALPRKYAPVDVAQGFDPVLREIGRGPVAPAPTLAQGKPKPKLKAWFDQAVSYVFGENKAARLQGRNDIIMALADETGLSPAEVDADFDNIVFEKVGTPTREKVNQFVLKYGMNVMMGAGLQPLLTLRAIPAATALTGTVGGVATFMVAQEAAERAVLPVVKAIEQKLSGEPVRWEVTKLKEVLPGELEGLGDVTEFVLYGLMAKGVHAAITKGMGLSPKAIGYRDRILAKLGVRARGGKPLTGDQLEQIKGLEVEMDRLAREPGVWQGNIEATRKVLNRQWNTNVQARAKALREAGRKVPETGTPQDSRDGREFRAASAEREMRDIGELFPPIPPASSGPGPRVPVGEARRMAEEQGVSLRGAPLGSGVKKGSNLDRLMRTAANQGYLYQKGDKWYMVGADGKAIEGKTAKGVFLRAGGEKWKPPAVAPEVKRFIPVDESRLTKAPPVLDQLEQVPPPVPAEEPFRLQAEPAPVKPVEPEVPAPAPVPVDQGQMALGEVPQAGVNRETPPETTVLLPDGRKGVLNQNPAGKYAWVRMPPDKAGTQDLVSVENDKLRIIPPAAEAPAAPVKPVSQAPAPAAPSVAKPPRATFDAALKEAKVDSPYTRKVYDLIPEGQWATEQSIKFAVAKAAFVGGEREAGVVSLRESLPEQLGKLVKAGILEKQVQGGSTKYAWKGTEAPVPTAPVVPVEKKAPAVPKAPEVTPGIAPLVPKAQETKTGETVVEGPAVLRMAPDGKMRPLVGDHFAIPREELTLAPDEMQYKKEIGMGGADSKLLTTQVWDPVAAGNLTVWLDPNTGQIKVVNGHGRYNLHRRLGVTTPMNVVFLDPNTYKTVPEARLYGAFQNIKEGNGRSIDAAIVFRETGMTRKQALDNGIQLDTGVGAEGMKLAKLNQDVFLMVVNEAMKPEVGAVIGEMAPDHAEQATIVESLKNVRREITPAIVKETITQVRSTGAVTEGGELPGMERVISLAGPKAELVKDIESMFSKEKSPASSAAGKGKEMESKGYVTGADIAKATADKERINKELVFFDAEKCQRGPIGAKLEEAAEELLRGGNENAISERLYGFIKQELANRFNGAGAPDMGGRAPQHQETAGTTAPRRKVPSAGKITQEPGRPAGEPPSVSQVAAMYRKEVPDIPEATATKNATGLLQAIATGTYTDLVFPANKVSRKIFKAITGKALPRGVKATKEVFKGESLYPKASVPAGPLSLSRLPGAATGRMRGAIGAFASGVPKERRDASKPPSVWDFPADQSITSAETTRSFTESMLPRIFRTAAWRKGSINADIGGGASDVATKYLAGKGVTNVVYDPFNRTTAHNIEAVEKIANRKSDTATVNNVLNVIRELGSRARVIAQAADAIKNNGTAYFTIYQGDGTGTGRVTKIKGGKSLTWQENRKTSSYAKEVRRYFDDVTVDGKLIIARKPRPSSSGAMGPGGTLERMAGAGKAGRVLLPDFKFKTRMQSALDGIKEAMAAAPSTLFPEKPVRAELLPDPEQYREQAETAATKHYIRQHVQELEEMSQAEGYKKGRAARKFYKGIEEEYGSKMKDMDRDTLRQVVFDHMGRGDGRLDADVNRRMQEAWVKGVAETLSRQLDHFPDQEPQIRRQARRLLYNLRLAIGPHSMPGLTMLEFLDGNRMGGAHTEFLYRGVNAATDQEIGLNESSVAAKENAVLSSGATPEALGAKRTWAVKDPKYTGELSVPEMITCYYAKQNPKLHAAVLGGNLKPIFREPQRVMDEAAAFIAGDQRYKRFADTLMRHIQGRYGALQKAFKELGIDMGQVRNYWPIRRIAEYLDTGGATTVEEALKQMANMEAGVSGSSLAKHRQTLDHQPAVDMDALAVFDQVSRMQSHLISHAPLQNTVGAVIRDRGWRMQMEKKVGPDFLHMVDTWYRHTINPYEYMIQKEGASRVSAIIRGRLSTSMLFLNVPVSLVQSVSALHGLQEVDPGLYASVAREVLAHPVRSFKELGVLFPQLRKRALVYAIQELKALEEVNEGTFLKLGKHNVGGFVMKVGEKMLTGPDLLASMICLKTRMTQGLRDGATPEEAKWLAMKLFLRTQSQFAPKDTAHAMRTSELYRVLSQFTSESIRVYNQLTKDIPMEWKQGPEGRKKALRIIMSTALTSVFAWWIRHGRPPSDPKEWAQAIAETSYSSVPGGFGSALQSSLNRFRGGSPTEMLVGEAGEAVADVFRGNLPGVLPHAAKVFATGAGIPTYGPLRAAQGAYDLATGETKDPRRLVISPKMLYKKEPKKKGPGYIPAYP